jgi:hypothetical protein
MALSAAAGQEFAVRWHVDRHLLGEPGHAGLYALQSDASAALGEGAAARRAAEEFLHREPDDAAALGRRGRATPSTATGTRL